MVGDDTATRRPRISWPHTLAAAIVPYLLAHAIGFAAYGVTVRPVGLALDLGITLVLVAWLRGAVRGLGAIWVAGVLAALAFHLFPAIKIAFLGEPVVASDLWASVSLFDILTGWRKALAMVGVALVAGALAWSLWPRRGGFLHLAGAVLSAAGFVVGIGLWSETPRFPTGPRTDVFEHVGGAAFVVSDIARYRRDRGELPSYATIQAINAGVREVVSAPGPEFRRRNVHVILVEAAWDVRQLKSYAFSDDPWDPRFRRAWNEGKGSHLLTPVFGGATANAEFEILCGLPAGDTAIVFQDRLKNAFACLPRVLRAAGYRTQASHPFEADFWSRDRAYGLVGFETYNPASAFERDELDGPFLSDSTLLRQLLLNERTSKDVRPVFNYVVTLSSHYPYERDSARRPALISVKPDLALLRDYANGIRYSTGAVMDLVEQIHADDPDALVVITGDHAPVLGTSPNPYRISDVLLPGETSDPGQVAVLQTPLVVIDGRMGAVPVGTVPMRRVPALVLELLGKGAPGLPAAVWERAQPDPWSSHVFLGKLFIRRQDGTWRGCWPDEPECAAGFKQQQDLTLLRRDLVRGYRYSAARLGAQHMLAPTTMTITEGPCTFPVADWGPRQVEKGSGFYVQPDGKSALWATLSAHSRGQLYLEIDGERAPVLVVDQNASATFTGNFLQREGTFPVSWGCGSKKRGVIGQLQVGQMAPMASSAGATTATPQAVPAAPAPTRCAAKVLDWGPKQISVGQPFNQQGGGASAYWVRLGPGSGGFETRLNGAAVDAVIGGDTLTFLHDPAWDAVAKRDGRLRFDLICGRKAVGTIFVVAETETGSATKP